MGKDGFNPVRAESQLCASFDAARKRMDEVGVVGMFYRVAPLLNMSVEVISDFGTSKALKTGLYPYVSMGVDLNGSEASTRDILKAYPDPLRTDQIEVVVLHETTGVTDRFGGESGGGYTKRRDVVKIEDLIKTLFNRLKEMTPMDGALGRKVKQALNNKE